MLSANDLVDSSQHPYEENSIFSSLGMKDHNLEEAKRMRSSHV